MADQLSKAQQQAMQFLRSGSAAQLGTIGAQFGEMLAILVAELADAKAEAKHFKASFDVVSREMKAAIGVALRQAKAERLVVTRQDLNELGHERMTLFVGRPTQDVRVYELRKQTVVDVPGKVGPALKLVQ